MKKVNIIWPDGKRTLITEGTLWLDAALQAGVTIPSGCLGGSCGACEIEVNGKVLRACISKVKKGTSDCLKVDFSVDPYW